jgi:hypothetical protein
MPFTNIQLDDFTGMLARFLERLEMEGEGVEDRKWIMMCVVNIGAVLEHDRASSVVRKAGGFGGTKEGMHTNRASRSWLREPLLSRRNKDGRRR